MKNRTKPQTRSERGFAIILTLLVITMMTILVVGFNAATRTEQLAARNFSYQEVSGQMAMRGVNEAIELLNVQLASPDVATRPGAAYLLPSPNPIPLTSASVAGANGNNKTNINIRRQGTNGFNYFIMSNNNSAAFTVPLVDVKLSQVPGGGAAPDAPIGRFGFWIDDDGSRLNLNYAAPYGPGSMPPNRPDFLPTNARPLVLTTNVLTNLTLLNLVQQGTNSVLSLVNPSAAQQNNAGLGWGYFFTPRQIANLAGMTEARYNSAMFQVGAGPASAPDRSYPLLAGLGREPLDLAAGGANGLLSRSEFGGQPNFASGFSQLIAAMDGIISSYFRGASYEGYFGDKNGLTTKYTTNIARQIVANVNDAVMPSTDLFFTGANTNNMLSTTNSDLFGVYPVPRSVLGNRASPYLNEVGFGVVHGSRPSSEGRAEEIQIWIHSELVNPYGGQAKNFTGYEIKHRLYSLEFSGTFEADGEITKFKNPPTSQPWAGFSNSTSVYHTNTIPRGAYVRPQNAFAFEWGLLGSGGAVPPIPENASNITLVSVAVKPDMTLLRAITNRLSDYSDFTTKPPREVVNPLLIRDWAIADDFPVLVFTNLPKVTTILGYEGYGSRPPPASIVFTKSIEKNDPRVRRYPDYQPPEPAWTLSAGSLGAPNTAVNFSAGTSKLKLGSDKVTASQDIFGHPSFAPENADFKLLSQWRSPFDLSQIHTGLHWRTLQMRSQDADESKEDLVPDWALLEVCKVGVGGLSAPVRVNVNSVADSLLTPPNALSAGLARVPSLASILGGMTTQNAPTASIGGKPLNLPTASGFSEAVGTPATPGYLRVATNMATLNFTDAWSNRRKGGKLKNAHPAAAYALGAEVLEIKGVSDFSQDDAANEGRALGVFESFTTKSEVFTVYSVGYAVDRNDRVVSESLVRAQVAKDTNTGRFRLVFAEPLSWPP